MNISHDFGRDWLAQRRREWIERGPHVPVTQTVLSLVARVLTPLAELP